MFYSPILYICKFLRISLVGIFTAQWIFGIYIAFQFFNVITFMFWFFIASSLYLWIVNEIISISGCRIEENMLILKKVSNKIELMPLDQALILPMYIGRKLVLMRIKYHIDGIRRSTLVLTNSMEFGKIKKRQAISRVL